MRSFEAMPNKRRARPEDPVRFGRRLKFVDVTIQDEVVPWPCLEFSNIEELQAVLHAQDANFLSCPHRQHRLLVELIHHMRSGGSQNDPVVYLFGNKTPGGNRLVFCPSATYDYREYIRIAVDLMQHEPVYNLDTW